MGIALASSFTVNAALPLDDRTVTATTVTRDAIVAGQRYIGLIVHCLADSVNYQLQGGILNANWAVVGAGGGGTSPVVNTYAGDGVTTVFGPLTVDPVTEENTMIYVGGVYQEKTEYSLAAGSITLVTAPATGENVEIISGGINSLSTPSNNSVTTAKIQDGAVTKAKLAALGQQLSSSSGAYTVLSSGAFLDVTNLNVTITTTGRPVRLELISDGSSVSNFAELGSSSGGSSSLDVAIYRGATLVSVQRYAGTGTFNVPVAAASTTDIPAAGTYTYKVSVRSGGSVICNYTKLLAYEL